jgi:hypothetical protein
VSNSPHGYVVTKALPETLAVKHTP